MIALDVFRISGLLKYEGIHPQLLSGIQCDVAKLRKRCLWGMLISAVFAISAMTVILSWVYFPATMFGAYTNYVYVGLIVANIVQSILALRVYTHYFGYPYAQLLNYFSISSPALSKQSIEWMRDRAEALLSRKEMEVREARAKSDECVLIKSKTEEARQKEDEFDQMLTVFRTFELTTRVHRVPPMEQPRTAHLKTAV